MGDPGNREEKDSNFPIKDGEIDKKLKKSNKNIITYIKRENSFKKLIMISMMLIIAVLSLGVYKINEIQTRAYAVYYEDEEIAIVREKEEVINVLNNAKKELLGKYDCEIVLDNELKFEEIYSRDSSLTSTQRIEKNIASQLSFLVSGYTLLVDEEEIGYSKTKEELEQVIEKIKEPYLKTDNQDSKLLEIGFVEDVKIEKKKIPFNKINEVEELVEYIQIGGEEIKTHIVEVGESLWTIAKMYGVSVDDLIDANEAKNPEGLQIGDEVQLSLPDSLVTVVTKEEVEYTDDIKYEVKIEYDKDMYKTQRKVKAEGKEGETKYLINLVKHDGKIVKEEIIKEEVLLEPVDQLVVQGTRELPKTAATGAFLMPTRGRVSSRYGPRSGRMHYGLDIAASSGTPIKAADGGKVVYAGWKGSYGNLVEISHENGYVTRYAHCSSINVSAGQRVHKGQLVGRVGNTGRSTGPHLHFEVLKNGENVNPSSYVN